MTPETIYTRLIEWASARLFGPGALVEAIERLKPTTRGVETTAGKDADCGLEIHHVVPPTADFAIWADPKDLKQTRPGVIRGWLESDTATVKPNNSAAITYSPKCFYEIDQDDESAVLAGVFHSFRVKAPKSNTTAVLNDVSTGLGALSTDYLALPNSKAVEKLLNFIEFPQHIGRMVGRGTILKLTGRLPPSELRNLPNLFPQVLQETSRQRWLRVVEEALHLLADLYLSVDVDLTRDELLPRFGLELYFVKGSERRKMVSAFFKAVAGLLPSGHSNNLVGAIKSLPIGQNVWCRETAISNLFVPPDTLFCAQLSHLKLVFSASSHCTLKSYIHLLSSSDGVAAAGGRSDFGRASAPFESQLDQPN